MPRFATPTQQTFTTLEGFESFAMAFARTLQPGDVIALSGDLGAGKTTFVRAAVRACHGEDQTSSPTFTFWHRYQPTPQLPAPPIDHLDLYRVEDPRELTELGLDEVFDGTSIVFIEWWTHAPRLLPAHRYEVTVAGSGDEPRTVSVR